MSNKALLMGSAPRVKEDLEIVKISEYSLVCGINQVFVREVRSLYDRFGVKLNCYFTSDWFLNSNAGDIEALSVQAKIIITPKHLARPDLSGLMGARHCPSDVVSYVDDIGAFPSSRWATCGLYALCYLLHYTRVDFVDLAGFSFGEGKYHLYDNCSQDWPHETAFEKKIYKHFYSMGLCSLVE